MPIFLVFFCLILQSFCFPGASFSGPTITNHNSKPVIEIKHNDSSNKKYDVITTFRELTKGPEGHLWGVPSRDSRIFMEWDGETWKEHPLPSNYNYKDFYYLAFDSFNRLWFIPGSSEREAAIFEPKTEKFLVYRGYQEALISQLPTENNFNLGEKDFMKPSFSQDGHICYRSCWWKVTYYDGKNWFQWGREQIKKDDSFVLDGPPFFNQEGILCVNIENKTWAFTIQKGWHITTNHPGLFKVCHAFKNLIPPKGSVTNRPESITQDEKGIIWFTWEKNLYKAISGFCFPQFSSNESNPFIDGRGINNVLMDKKGNVFIQTSKRGRYEYVVLYNLSEPPETIVNVEKISEDSFVINFTSFQGENVWFYWRLDEEPWNAPIKEGEISLTYLSAGNHMVMVKAMNQQLQMDPTPEEVILTVDLDPTNQIRNWISLLKAEDFKVREKAVNALVRSDFGQVIPLLQEERKQADPDVEWWIKALLQKIRK